jgi:hypothetical protein
MAGPRSLTYITQPIARKAIGRKHADLGLLLDHWDDIVGPQMSRYAVPERIAKGRQGGATIHIRVTPGAAARIQHEIPRLIERLNAVLGPAAVEAVRLSQGEVGTRNPSKRQPPPLPAGDADALNKILAKVTDPALKTALAALGEVVFRRGRERNATDAGISRPSRRLR